MTTLEIVATVLTVACVLLANFRSTWQYPIGILGTIAFFFVVWSAGLFANAGLQVFFTCVQLYGWWFWLRGGVNNTRPKITSLGLGMTAKYVGLVALVSLAASQVCPGVMGVVDCVVFGLSVMAQFLLDRKKIENWIVWGVVNVLSIYLYATSGLYLLTALYVGLLINTFVAYGMWKKELQNEQG
jgi:nicotinamide mononucleotide transporter